MAERSLKPAPTGHEVLSKAFDESAGKTIDLVVDQEVAGVTPEMFHWWSVKGMQPYYRVWWPEMHFINETVMVGGTPRRLIKEMVTPYYIEMYLCPEAGAFTWINPDEKKIGKITPTASESSRGIKLRMVFTFPAKTPQAFLDAMHKHCIGEMQDLSRFLPELYKQQLNG